MYEIHSLFIVKAKEQKVKRTMGNRHGGVAQLGEHLPCKQGVMGSNPIISTKSVKTDKEKGSRRKRKRPRGLRAHSSGG